MAEEHDNEGSENTSGAGVQTQEKPRKAPSPKRNPPKPLPPWKVLLHNDDVNAFDYVIVTITSLTPLNKDQALQRTLEADKSGVALLLTTHRERAELYQEQFQSKGLTVTIEPAESE